MLAEVSVSVFIVLWSLTNLRSGRWALVALIGALLFPAVNVTYLVAYSAPSWLDIHTDLLSWTFNNSAMLGWTRVVGLAAFVVASTVGRSRTKAPPAGTPVA